LFVQICKLEKRKGVLVRGIEWIRREKEQGRRRSSGYIGAYVVGVLGWELKESTSEKGGVEKYRSGT